MKDTGIGKYTVSFALAFAVTSLLSAVLVVAKERNEDTLLAWMKAATGHHWISHGILDLLVFVLLGWALAQIGFGARWSGNVLSAIITSSVVLSSLIIAGFFV
ncbi:hypothetical protein PH586_08440 [Pseudomonas sp. SA3-5]|uniref:Uncharacterized protein n=1 Tax=Pseudomonas aestuarii TaxID=3018340 RepID=A0ABT4XDX3_9PSED|nr:hypothetical protein [Pseudomonas aestuarii]MDA7086404.1 hypothetical protein [Pseudomonas aestuarii]